MLQLHLIIDDFHPERESHMNLVRKEMYSLFQVVGYGNMCIHEYFFSETDIAQLQKNPLNTDIVFVAAPIAMAASNFKPITKLNYGVPIMVLDVDKSRETILGLFQNFKYLAVVPSHGLVKPDDIITWARLWNLQHTGKSEIVSDAATNNRVAYLELPQPRSSVRPAAAPPRKTGEIVRFPEPGKTN